MINTDFKFIFIHVPKTGGTSIERVFDETADQRDVELKHETIGYFKEHFPIEYESYFSFTAVRNTWDWLVSRYHWNLSADNKTSNWPMHKKLFNYSFAEFVRRVCEGQDLSGKKKWLRLAVRPQLDRLVIDGKISVDFIARFEYLQTDFDTICDKIGRPRITLPHIYRTRHKHYSEYYTPELRDAVAQKFKQDIDTFGFEFHSSR